VIAVRCGYILRRPFRSRRRLPSAFPFVLAVAVGSVLLFSSVSRRLKPLVETIATSRAVNEISLAVSESVDLTLSEQQTKYNDFVETKWDASGRITSLSFRVSEGNAFKRDVISHLCVRLAAIDSDVLSVPIGNLTGILLFSAHGPDIRVSVRSVGDVTAVFENEFTSAGVNQTRHSVYLNVSVTIYLLLPGEIIPVLAEERVCVAETVIVGDVPNTYLNLQDGAT